MKLWTLGIICLACSLPAGAQSCAHTVTRSPVGPVMVFQNGLLLALGANYTYTTAPGTFPVIGPLSFSVGDTFQVVFTRQVPLSFTYQGVKVPYIGYALWQESWACTQGNKTSAAVLGSVLLCSGSGGTVPNAWDCGGLYAVSITLGSGTVLSILGPSMAVPTPAPGVTWAPVN